MSRVKSFRLDGCNAYLLWQDQGRAREGIIIDPNWQAIEEYREFVLERGIRLKLVVDTHIHADHRSASHWVASELGAEIAMGALTKSARPSKLLSDGDSLDWAGGRISVLSTPGHTPDSICLVTDFGSRAGVFTGDTLLAGSTGRTDFKGSDAGELFDSLRRLERELPRDALIFSGHDYSGVLFSVLERELAENSQLNVKDRAEFARIKREELIAAPAVELKDVIEFNLAKSPPAPAMSDFGSACKTACGGAMDLSGTFSSISIQKYRERFKHKTTTTRFIDVRERDEFDAGHMIGTENLPLSDLALRLQELSPNEKIFVSCLSGRRSQLAAQTLSYLGFTDVVNVSGGYQAWVQAGFEVQKD